MNCPQEQLRTAMLLGCDAVEKLQKARVAVFGVGGVGGYACEALARAGVGAIDLFDRDVISLSNINRQIIALHSTVGRPKVEVMKERILDIRPDCKVNANEVFYLPENAEAFPLDGYDCILDAVDTVSAKIELAVRAERAGVPLLSAMGAGNKLDPSRFTVTDLYKTSGCPLARVMRRELKARGMRKLTVVYSPEPAAAPPLDPPQDASEDVSKKRPPASISYVPSVAGLLLAGEAIRILTKK